MKGSLIKLSCVVALATLISSGAFLTPRDANATNDCKCKTAECAATNCGPISSQNPKPVCPNGVELTDSKGKKIGTCTCKKKENGDAYDPGQATCTINASMVVGSDASSMKSTVYNLPDDMAALNAYIERMNLRHTSNTAAGVDTK